MPSNLNSARLGMRGEKGHEVNQARFQRGVTAPAWQPSRWEPKGFTTCGTLWRKLRDE